MAVTKRLRFEILRRDNHACRYCGATAPEAKLTVDHVVAVALGGSDDPSNLVAACSDCNSGKSATPAGAPLVADVKHKALVWAAAMQVAAEERAVSDSHRRARDNAFECEWELHRPHQFRSCDLGSGWSTSLDRFNEAGLTDRELIELIPYVATSRAGDKWRYFCGCAWNKVKALQDRASEIISDLEDDPHG